MVDRSYTPADPDERARQLVRAVAQEPSHQRSRNLHLRRGRERNFTITGVNGVAYDVRVVEKELTPRDQLMARVHAGALSEEDKIALGRLLGHVSDELVAEAAPPQPLYDRKE